PMWIDGKQLNQGDIVHYKAVSKELQDYREKQSGEALWSNSMFGGMPAFQVSTLYNGNLTRYVHDLFTFFLPHPSGLLILSFVTMYILLMVMGCGSFLAIGGALAFGLSTYNLTLFEAGHNSKIAAIAYMPLVTAGMVLLFRRQFLWGFAVFALGLALEIRSNHLQITYYLALVLGIYFVVEAVQMIRKKHLNDLLKSSGLLLAGAVLAVASNASLLWSTSSYVGETIRGKSELSSNTQSTGGLDKDYAFQWSYGKAETFTLLIPDFMGGSSNHELGENSAVAKALSQQGADPQTVAQYIQQMPTFWGDKPFTSGPFYVGAIFCFLFVLGLIIVKDTMRWWLLGATLLALFMAWGRNFDAFNDLMFNFLPGYNRFRTVEMILIAVQLTFVVLSLRALQLIYWNEVTRADVERGVKIAAGVTGGLCVLMAVIGSGFFDFRSPNDARYPEWLRNALVADRKSLMQMDAWRSAGFILAAAVLIWLLAKDKLRRTYALGGVLLLGVIDIAAVDKRYFGSDNFVPKDQYEQYFAMTPADQQILQDNSLNFRVLNVAGGNPFADSRTSYFHKSIGGYSAVKLRRYQELYEFQIAKNNGDVLDMLNTRYLIVKGQNEGEERAQPNRTALGNAWFVDSLRWVKNADEEINRIGPMYRIQAVGNTQITVNEKQVQQAEFGNHDHAKVGGVAFDPAQFNLPHGFTDTLGLVRNEKGETGFQPKARESRFVITRHYRFSPRTVAVIDERFRDKVGNIALQPDPTRSIQLTSYAPNRLEYKSNASTESFAVFSEIYYPDGWNITIDGKQAEMMRVNYVLRGMKIPAGQHTIVFEFKPKSFHTGQTVSFASSGFLMLLLIGLIVRDLIEKRKKETGKV
ncbi:MAG TPA: YfhO family protein, partial [Chitinophagales bacterium]|nr:YfhO family protein [Chitinophagales bacterium]